MKRSQVRHIWADYLKQYWLGVAALLLCAGIFLLIFHLYSLNLEPVLYAFALCGLVLAIVIILGFIPFYRRSAARLRVLEQPVLLLDQLPEPGSLPEEDYQQILDALRSHYDGEITRWKQNRQEMMDYYTAWTHQIKIPIAVMRMMLRDEDTPEHQILDNQLFRVEQYVDMALGYIRLDGYGSDLVIRPCELDAILRDAIHKYAGQFIHAGISLRYQPVSKTVLTDEKWLIFLIEQIFSNAVKYAAGGTVSVTVEDEVLHIADTGCGISPEDLPRVFEKGFTGYNGRQERTSTGLGLYLCRQTANKLGHRIWIESEPGQGTICCIDLHRDKLGVE